MTTIPPTVPPDVANVLRALSVRIDRWDGPNSVDLHQRRIINAGHAVDVNDYVTNTDLRQALLGVQSAPVAPPAGTSPGTGITFGTHAQRQALVPAAIKAPFFFESDREALYAVQMTPAPPQWALLSAAMTGSLAGRPGDLGLNEEGFVFYAQDVGVVYYWSGAVWHAEVGNIVDVFANRPAVGGTNLAGGLRFTASDRGYQEWEYDLANTRWQFAGGGQPTVTVIASLTAGLGAQDTGYLNAASDYDRVYRWTGSAWADAPGQPTRGLIAFFDSALAPGTGWQLCDGTAATRSTATGGTTPYTVPNLTTANRFLRSVAGASGDVGGSVTTHTHQVDPPNTTSGVESADVVLAVAIGAGTTVAAQNHTHDTNIAAFASAGPSGVGGADALPPYYSARPYVRL